MAQKNTEKTYQMQSLGVAVVWKEDTSLVTSFMQFEVFALYMLGISHQFKNISEGLERWFCS